MAIGAGDLFQLPSQPNLRPAYCPFAFNEWAGGLLIGDLLISDLLIDGLLVSEERDC